MYTSCNIENLGPYCKPTEFISLYTYVTSL